MVPEWTIRGSSKIKIKYTIVVKCCRDYPKVVIQSLSFSLAYKLQVESSFNGSDAVYSENTLFAKMFLTNLKSTCQLSIIELIVSTTLKVTSQITYFRPLHQYIPPLIENLNCRERPSVPYHCCTPPSLGSITNSMLRIEIIKYLFSYKYIDVFSLFCIIEFYQGLQKIVPSTWTNCPNSQTFSKST